MFLRLQLNRAPPTGAAKNAFRIIALTVCLAILYILGTRASILFADLVADGSIRKNWVPFWLPSGLALAAVMRFGPAALPGIFIGSCLANLSLKAPFAIAVWLAAVNASQPLLIVALLRRWSVPESPFLTGRGVACFVAATFIGCCLYGAVLGPVGFAMAGWMKLGAFPVEWMRWALGDITAILILTPIILIALHPWAQPRGDMIMTETFAVMLIGAGLVAVVFSDMLVGGPLHHLSLEFLLFPLIIWAALRGTLLTTTSLVFVMSVAIAVCTAFGHGPISNAAPSREALIMLQALIAVLAVTGLLLTATSGERRFSQARLKETLEGLDHLVRARTAALDNANRRLAMEAAQHAQISRINEGRSRLLQKLTTGERLESLLSILEREIERTAPDWKVRIDVGATSMRYRHVAAAGVERHDIKGAEGRVLALMFIERPIGRALSEQQVGLIEESADLVRLIVEFKANEHRLQRLARYDTLTGALNRGAFSAELSTLMQEIDGPAGTLSLLYVDLDGFKAVNDTCGHALGDTILKEVVERFQVLAGPRAVIGRLGGDEFVIALPRICDREIVSLMAGRLVDCCASLSTGDAAPPITASIGIGRYPVDGTTATDLLIAADTAMYSAKRAGGSRYVFSDAQIDPRESRAAG